MNAPAPTSPEGLWDRRILALAVPAFLSSAVPLVHRWVDMAWLKELGTEATAALSLAAISTWFYMALGVLIGIGLTALVARYVGAGKEAGARYVASQGMRWGVGVGLLGAAIGWVGAPLLFHVAQADPGVDAQGMPYVRIYWGTGALTMVQFAGDAIFRGHGNTRTPMRIAVTALTLNVALDPLFIFGWGPVPALGVAGAATATATATAFAAFLHLRALRSARYLDRARPADELLRFTPSTPLGQPAAFGLDPAVLKRVVRVGVPAALASVLFNGITLVLMRCAQESGGSAAQAGLGVGYSGEGIAYVMGLGWSAAASALVGQRLGAGRPDEAHQYAWRAAWQCAVLSGIWGVALFVFDEPLATLFAREADAVGYGAQYYRIVAFCLMPQAVELVLTGAFGGAGLTVPPMVIAMVFSLARVPLAYFAAFTLEMGPAGIFVVIAATAVVRGLVTAAWFQRGTWKTREV
ncbi:MAG: MATE family efflux transporter [Planctomycetota bacterium]|nr:MATE family efflux transporter [Planctomycetota bacterium]